MASTDWLINLLPLILLVAFWVYVARGRGGTSVSTDRQVELLQQQVEILKEMNQSLKKLAATR